MLIAPQTLHRQLGSPQIVIFDCRHDLSDTTRGRQLYGEQHLPGAFFAHVDENLSGPMTGQNGRHPAPSPERFARFLESCGVTRGTHLVAYDDVGGQYAARFWWLARWIGFENGQVAVLDGGLPKWNALGLPTTTATPQPAQTGSVTIQLRDSLRAPLEEIERIVGNPGVAKQKIVDARAPERYRGDTESLDRKAGHIPGALNRFFKNNLNADLTMRPAHELRAEFEQLLGDAPPASVIHQCGSGITACANLLAMEHAGLKGSRLYVGSWSEWIAEDYRPVAKGG
jgi:thiosulfate/3-mercaptopyruvate sulfurtransferase